MKQYYEAWKKLSIKKTLTGIAALEAVKSDGDALRYVKDQTESVCLEAVKRYGDALRYVKEEIFIKAEVVEIKETIII